MEYAIALLIFLAIMAVTAVVFCVWLAVVIVRTIVHGIGALVMPAPKPPMQMGARGIICQNSQCRALNTESASFCRRCGSQLPQAQRVTAKRVAAL